MKTGWDDLMYFYWLSKFPKALQTDFLKKQVWRQIPTEIGSLIMVYLC